MRMEVNTSQEAAAEVTLLEEVSLVKFDASLG